METLNQNKIAENELLELAKKKFKKRRDFFTHTFIYIIGIVVWLLKTYTNAPLHFFPIEHINWFVMCIWTVAYAIQGIELLLNEAVFGKKWEEKQIKNMLEQKQKKQTWE